MSGEFDVSVVVASRNRADSLRRTLIALRDVTLPEGLTIEAILVDNDSTDDTASVMRGFVWPGVSVWREHVVKAGVPAAHNAAVKSARGAAILFCDDDVRPPANWIARMSEPILAGTADAVGGGIRIAPDVKPAWATPDHEEWLASTEFWEPDRDPLLVGANMAIGRHVFEAIGGFDEDQISTPDTVFSLRLRSARFRLVLRHDVVVDHLPDPDRFTREGVEAQARRRADGEAFLVRHFESGRRRFWQLRWEGRRLLFPRIRWLAARIRLARYRARLGELTDANLTGEEMRLMQRAAFWPEYLRRRREPLRRLDRTRAGQRTGCDVPAAGASGSFESAVKSQAR